MKQMIHAMTRQRHSNKEYWLGGTINDGFTGTVVVTWHTSIAASGEGQSGNDSWLGHT